MNGRTKLLLILVAVGVVAVAVYWAGRHGQKAGKKAMADRLEELRAKRLKTYEDGARKEAEMLGGVFQDGVVMSASAGMHKIRVTPTKWSDRKFLIVRGRVTNSKRDEKPIRFRDWPVSDFAIPGGRASLTDDRSHRYKRVKPAVAEQSRPRSIAFWEHGKDQFAFEPPSGGIEYLELKLPGERVGSKETFVMRIPAEKIRGL